MDKKTDIINDMEFTSLFQKSKELIDNARNNMGQMANAITVITSFLLGHYIIEQEQQGQERAKYGSKIIDSLSAYLTKEYGRGFSRSNVAGMRQFYMTYKDREDEIVQLKIGQLDIVYSKLPFKLSWTHYQVLMRIKDKDERDFYEKEAIRSGWNVSTLKRQYHSSLYERLALSRNKDDVLRLANEGAIPQKPEDILHTPYILEFAGLEDKASYHESDLESAVIGKMQKFFCVIRANFVGFHEIYHSSNESSALIHICKLPSSAKRAYSSGSSIASVSKAHCEQGVVLIPSSALLQSIRKSTHQRWIYQCCCGTYYILHI